MPLIEQEIVDRTGWMTFTEFSDLIAIDKLTPGPIIINSATFIGMKLGGIPGAIAATLGSILPACIVSIILFNLYKKYKTIPLISEMMNCLKSMSVAMILLDSYDELLQDAKESEKTRILGAIEEALEKFSIEYNCYLSRTSRRDRYIAIIEERNLKKILEGRFHLLDDIRDLEFTDIKGRASISIGVGRGASNLADAEKLAEQALEMALGRGGDQAAVKNENGSFEFFGGIHRGVEKRTKVKSRIVASALKDLIMEADNVMVMGHRYADIDSLGSAVGAASMALSCDKPTYIVLDPTKNLATALLKRVYENGFNDVFVTPPHALKLVKPHTLLIIVDTHVAMLTESADLLDACQDTVIIDHHRKMVGHIEATRIFYHEPNASSASEMVTELLQYFGDNHIIGAIEAEALLAGITLDTKNFVMGTGVRTFEAAAYLRKMGADTVEVKKMFSGSMSAYQKRTKLVSSHTFTATVLLPVPRIPPTRLKLLLRKQPMSC